MTHQTSPRFFPLLPVLLQQVLECFFDHLLKAPALPIRQDFDLNQQVFVYPGSHLWPDLFL